MQRSYYLLIIALIQASFGLIAAQQSYCVGRYGCSLSSPIGEHVLLNTSSNCHDSSNLLCAEIVQYYQWGFCYGGSVMYTCENGLGTAVIGYTNPPPAASPLTQTQIQQALNQFQSSTSTRGTDGSISTLLQYGRYSDFTSAICTLPSTSLNSFIITIGTTPSPISSGANPAISASGVTATADLIQDAPQLSNVRASVHAFNQNAPPLYTQFVMTKAKLQSLCASTTTSGLPANALLVSWSDSSLLFTLMVSNTPTLYSVAHIPVLDASNNTLPFNQVSLNLTTSVTLLPIDTSSNALSVFAGSNSLLFALIAVLTLLCTL